MSDFYIVPFTSEEYRAFHRQEFTLRVDEVIFKSKLRFKHQPEKLSNAVVLEAFSYDPSLVHVPELTEYNEFLIVMFFSEGYMRLFQDIGLTLNVKGTIPQESLPEGLERARSGMYYPE